VLAIVLSRVLRRRARSARPRTGLSFFREGLVVRLALMAVAQAGRDDATNSFAGLGPISVDHGDCKPLRQSDGDDSRFSVVPAAVVALQSGAIEDQCCELEVELSLAEVARALRAIPAEAHLLEYTNVYTIRKRCNGAA